MNPTNQFLKKQGLKVCLPLLLLATACGEGTPSSLQSDTNKPVDTSVVASAGTGGAFVTPSASSAGLPTPAITVTPPAEKPLNEVLPPSGTGTTPVAGAPVGSGTSGTTKVPEPTALMGLAIAAAGMVVIKRKQAA
jgi:hypothetical protein